MRALVVGLFLIAACAPAAQPSASAPPTGSPSPTSPASTVSPAASPNANIAGITELRSSVERAAIGAASQADLDAVVAADADFALRLYQRLVATEQGNVFISPYSISTALSMAYAGARGQTAQEMAAVLGIGADQDAWHAGRNRLDLAMTDASGGEPLANGASPLTLEPTNAVFGQADYPFKTDFLDLLAAEYGAGMQTVDFAADPEAGRQQINAWVAQRTRDRIDELLAQGVITEMTKMVLVNAIFFKASWVWAFDPSQTAPAPFHLLDGTTKDVPMMHADPRTNYATGDGWQAIRLPYYGASMLVVVPDEGLFADIEASLDAAFITDLSSALGDAQVMLTMPKWESESSLGLIPPLEEMGMHDLFDPMRADLSAITDATRLFVTDVVHQANVTVDEAGTEAAAATAVVVGDAAAPQTITLTLDRPFIYLIEDDATGEILFLGRLLEP